MAPGIMLPTTLLDGTLYRVTYEGPRTNDWTYQYDLVENTTGYACTVQLTARSGAALRRCRKETLDTILQATAAAMHEIITDEASWERARATHPHTVARRLTITSAHREPFGEVASRILTSLARLREATIRWPLSIKSGNLTSCRRARLAFFAAQRTGPLDGLPLVVVPYRRLLFFSLGSLILVSS